MFFESSVARFSAKRRLKTHETKKNGDGIFDGRVQEMIFICEEILPGIKIEIKILQVKIAVFPKCLVFEDLHFPFSPLLTLKLYPRRPSKTPILTWSRPSSPLSIREDPQHVSQSKYERIRDMQQESVFVIVVVVFAASYENILPLTSRA
jgi:hypothetical protein